MQARVRIVFSSPLVRIVDWRCTGGRPEPFGPEEWNDAHEVIVVRRGAFVRRAAGREVVVDPGTVAFTQAEESYTVRHPLAEGDACTAFRLESTAVTELVASHTSEDGPGPVGFPIPAAPLDGRAFLLHRLALHAALSRTATPLEVEERAAAFLRLAMAAAADSARDREAAGSARRNRRALEYAARVREVVGRRYREPLTLGEIGREVGCSPFHLHRMVRAELGVPIHRLVLRLRLRDALERLLETRDSVSSIAYAAGFASHSHLTDAFGREYGMAPRTVRGLAARDLHPLQRLARIR